MLSRTARYALRTLGFLVENQGSRIRAEQIAAATGIPANYLSKILNQLRKQGLVDSEKGWGGGFELRPDALELPIREVLTIFDGAESVDRKDCAFGLPRCDADHPCPLHPYWERIKATLSEMVSAEKVGDLGASA